MTTDYPRVDHVPVFDRAWDDPRNTRIELPPLDVNQVLAERYALAEPVRLTRTQLWEMESRKARRPDLYIPYVVEAGSASVWADRPLSTRVETFVRASRQRQWLEPERYEWVLEQTRVDHDEQKVTFIGAPTYPGADGERRVAGTQQPIFHVVHAVGGEEERPLNLWSVVFLTPQPQPRWLAPFERMAREGGLPGYVEVYLRNDLGTALPAPAKT